MRPMLILGLTLMVGFSPAFAEDGCPAGHKLGLIGTPQTASAVISTAGHDVRLISFLSSSTASVAGLYDVDTLGETTASPKLEVGSAASTFAFFPESGFLDPPLRFDTGITFVDDGNVDYIALYECVQK